jgi:hypothetical protein
MSDKPTTSTTPDPELFLPEHQPIGGLDGDNARGETAACPTGLSDGGQQSAIRRPGGAGAPGTGNDEENEDVPVM